MGPTQSAQQAHSQQPYRLEPPHSLNQGNNVETVSSSPNLTASQNNDADLSEVTSRLRNTVLHPKEDKPSHQASAQ